jgi:glycosyltransferase involved in cell wall biosynthesis
MEALARALSERGIDVTVLAPMPSFPSGRIDEGYRGKYFVRETWEDVEVVRLRHIATARRFGRYFAWLSFAFLATVYAAVFARRPDVVIMSSPPITLGLPAMAVRLLRGARLVVDVRDVFPDLPIQMGVWRKSGFTARAVGALADTLYRLASLIVVVTPTAFTQVRAKSGETPVVLAPNGLDRVEARAGVIQRRNGEFVATFAGNMGIANGMDLLLDAAKLLRDEEIRIALVGGGADYEHVAARVAREGIGNVDLYGVVSRHHAVGALAESDAAIVILREGVRESVPTKLFDAFGVRCPVVLSAGGEARRVVTEAVGGVCSAPGDAESLADALRLLAADRDLARALGEAGSRYATGYDRERIVGDLAERVASLCQG